MIKPRSPLSVGDDRRRSKDWDSAYIDFKKAYELNPKIDYLKEDLIRAAIYSRRPEDLAMWRAKFPGVKPANLKDVGEIVLIYQQGWGRRSAPLSRGFRKS